MLKVNKTYNDVALNNIFVKTAGGNFTDVADKLRSAVSCAAEKICIVLEKGLSDEIAQMLTDCQARKYIIVPTIEESKFAKISENMIVREVDNIKGNYAIIDEKELFLFDNTLLGTVITSPKAVETIRQLFLKEFWENGQAEYIKEKGKCAEITFDIPPIYGNDEFLLDESFEGRTEIQKLLDNAKAVGCIGKAFSSHVESLIIKDAKSNKNYLETATDENIYLVPELPFSTVNDGYDNYILNFNPEDYAVLPEKGRGRLFAVKCNELRLGTTYQFYRHKTVAELLNTEILSITGNPLHIDRHREENKKIDADLRMAREYSRMDDETLETRLEKKHPDIFDIDGYASEVCFNIEVCLLKHTFNKRAAVYNDYLKAESEITQKLKEIEIRKDKTNLGVVREYLTKLPKIDTAAAYKEIVVNINRVIELINHNSNDSAEEALSEVTGNMKKKQIQIQPIQLREITRDLPKFGVLYQDSDRFEYVLTGEKDLDAAINEMKVYGIENTKILYLSE